MDKIKIVLVGLGAESQARHIRILQRHPLFDLIGLVDCRKEAILSVTPDFRGKTAVADRLDNIPWLGEADAVVIATSLGSHYELIKQALLMNLHVLTEKPFVETIRQGEELVALARNRQVHLAIMHNWLFASAAVQLRRDLLANRLGPVHGLSLHCLNNPQRPVPAWHLQLPMGQIYDESPHCLYLLRAFAPGRLAWKNRTILPGIARRGNTPAQLSADFIAVTPGSPEIPVHLYFNFDSPVCEWRLAVYGEKGMSTIDMFRNIYCFIRNDGSHGAWPLIRTAGSFFLQHWAQHLSLGCRYLSGNWHLGHDQVFDRFARALTANGSTAGVDGEDALDVLKLQHDMMGLNEEGKTVGIPASVQQQPPIEE